MKQEYKTKEGFYIYTATLSNGEEVKINTGKEFTNALDCIRLVTEEFEDAPYLLSIRRGE